MRSTCGQIVVLMCGMVMIQATAAHGQAAASWLDEASIASWNTPGQSVPPAPKGQSSINPRCRDLSRSPQITEDKPVSDQGWDLIGPFQGGWDVAVVRATAGYDGMCRSVQYQDFVFVRGAFAGTLAPKPMDSRTDGALSQAVLQNSSQLMAEYVRYASSDPLCCPSRVTRVLFDIARDPAVVRARSAETQPTGTAAQTSTPSPTGLANTSWQLVKFEGGDGKVLTPDDRAKYTIAFEADGMVAARVDCNRGRGTWKSDGSSTIAFGPLALTRALCPPGLLHDQIARQWGNIRSYVIRDGHLFLSLMADGGIYEFEPVVKQK